MGVAYIAITSFVVVRHPGKSIKDTPKGLTQNPSCLLVLNVFAALQTDIIFETVCDGCPALCPGCDFGEDRNKTPRCAAELEHTRSDGGKGTLETLSINEGYWRATNTSDDVRACYNADACLGGPTGNDDYCKYGYRGPCEKRLITLRRECFFRLWSISQ